MTNALAQYSVPLMRSAFMHERRTLDALADWLKTYPAQLSMGEQCAAFEAQFAQYQGRKYAILFNSGASANLALCQSIYNMGLVPDATVGFSALTWPTNVMPIIQMGWRPVPIDVSPVTLNVTLQDVQHAYHTPQILFITNALGYLGDLDRIAEYCKSRHMLLIEDNCEALGSALPAGKAGNFGLAATFSFFVAHHLSTIEGGMVCTDDAGLADMLKMVRSNGWDRNLAPIEQDRWRFAYQVDDPFQATYTFYDLAYNLRPTEITGFLGQMQLGYLEENIAARLANHEALEHAAFSNPDLFVPHRARMSNFSPFAFPVVCQHSELRAEYVRKFQRAGVEVRPLIAGNMQRQPFYKRHVGSNKEIHLPGADMLHESAFYFGNNADLTSDDLSVLCGLLEGK